MLRGLAAAVLCAGVVAGCSSPSNPPPAAAPAQGATSATGPTSPAPTADASASPAGTGSATPGGTPDVASPGRYVFPVDGKSDYARDHHDYPASDVIAPCGAVIRAVTDGVVLEVSRVDRYDPAHPRGIDKGGLSVSILGDDGVRYYGSHFSAIDQPVQPGVRVAAGTRLGLVGRTGNTNGTCHLHFGLSPPCARTGDWWIRRGVIWPWSYLDAWRAGQARSPAPEITGWQAKQGCPAAPPGSG